MSILMEDHLHFLTGTLEGLIHQVRLLREHVEIVQAVHDQSGASDLVRIHGIVHALPYAGEIAVRLLLIRRDLF